MEYDIHLLSCGLRNLTASDKNFKRILKDKLIILLTKNDEGSYPWEQFSNSSTGMNRTYTYKTFPEYLKRWSKYTLDDLLSIFHDDLAMRDRLDVVMQRPDGNPHLTVDNIHSSERPTGTSAEAGLRRLRKDAPEIHAKVVAGEMSVNQGMIKAGLRKKTVSVNLSNAKSAAETLVKHGTAEFIEELVTILQRR